jgi:uncharacterized protein with NRDE domain
MCLVAFALEMSGSYPLLIAANRDERHARPAAAAAWWPDGQVLAGRDLTAGGTWLAIDRRGRVAAVTNIRDPGQHAAPRSRGALVTEFVTGDESAKAYAARATHAGAQFNAFNLLLFDGLALHYASNRAAAAELGKGLHVFSNAPREIEWPKLASARAAVSHAATLEAPIEPLFTMLADRRADGPLEHRYRTAHFVLGPEYGTRCSTVVVIDSAGNATFAERTFDSEGRQTGETREVFAVATAR